MVPCSFSNKSKSIFSNPLIIADTCTILFLGNIFHMESGLGCRIFKEMGESVTTFGLKHKLLMQTKCTVSLSLSFQKEKWDVDRDNPWAMRYDLWCNLPNPSFISPCLDSAFGRPERRMRLITKSLTIRTQWILFSFFFLLLTGDASACPPPPTHTSFLTQTTQRAVYTPCTKSNRLRFLIGLLVPMTKLSFNHFFFFFFFSSK